MLLLYRFLWIASALGVAAVMIMLSNPRAERPVVSNEWASVQQGRFSLQAPREFRAYRDALTQMGMNKPNTNRASEVYKLPPSFRFPSRSGGNQAHRFPLHAGGTLRRGSSTSLFS
jgi:hypothetical protein